jgi:hypothetical protein
MSGEKGKSGLTLKVAMEVETVLLMLTRMSARGE